MPLLTVKIGAARRDALTRAVTEMLAECTSRILGKDPAVTAIAIDYLDPRDWIVAGRALSETGASSFSLDIRVTDETNTKAEKARYIEEVFAGFTRILGNLHEESYVHVHDVRAAAYGYGGKTQEYRYQNQ